MSERELRAIEKDEGKKLSYDRDTIEIAEVPDKFSWAIEWAQAQTFEDDTYETAKEICLLIREEVNEHLSPVVTI